MRKLLAIALLSCALSACASLPGARMPAGELATAVHAWRAAGLPYDDRCEEEREQLRVTVADAATFAKLCGYAMCSEPRVPHCADSCFASVLSLRVDAPTIVLGALFDRPGHRAHELLHWLDSCAGRPVDAAHKDVTVWGSPIGSPASLLGKLGG